MHALLYLRLTVLTAGTLLPFFWIVVILGHRRNRDFERIFFFLCLALVLFFGGSLLALNAQLHYSNVPHALGEFAWIVVCVGLWSLPPQLVHLHVEYAGIRNQLSRLRKRCWLIANYATALLLAPSLFSALREQTKFNFGQPSNSLGLWFQVWLLTAILICAVWQMRFRRAAPDREQKSFHRNLEIYFLLTAVWIFGAHAYLWKWPGNEGAVVSYGAILGLFALAPLIHLVRNVQKYNFLQIGRQRNLLYAVSSVFAALLYLSLIRRVSQWLEPYLPPEATAALLLFLPVAFFEPLQRLIGTALRRTAQSEVDRVNHVMGPILEMARLGNPEKLTSFVETWIRRELQLAEVRLRLNGNEIVERGRKQEEDFAIQQSGRRVGVLRATPYGAMLSGETEAALEFLCEQLPGALDLCRLIEEKLRLERELAERERLAVLGQMAASISHNLKNPLGSIKTILQVQLEGPEMPETMRAETRMVLEEISRLSAKLNQLLQFSRPAVRAGAVSGICNARVVAEEVRGVLRREAERRGVKLEVDVAEEGAGLAASAEAVNEILSNLVVNALEATPRGGRVQVNGARNGKGFLFCVEDDGPGVAESAREKILQPFFTTKTQGTGLGLAIVARRVVEFGGRLEWQSPLKDGRGTRFEVSLPVSEAKKQ